MYISSMFNGIKFFHIPKHSARNIHKALEIRYIIKGNKRSSKDKKWIQLDFNLTGFSFLFLFLKSLSRFSLILKELSLN